MVLRLEPVGRHEHSRTIGAEVEAAEDVEIQFDVGRCIRSGAGRLAVPHCRCESPTRSKEPISNIQHSV